MDLSKCKCSCPGFCKIFNRVMGLDPPDWEWCQKSSETQRRSFYNIVSKEKPEPKQSRRFVRTSDLYRVASDLIPYLEKFDGFVGVPRSGMLPASYLSVLLSKPLFSIVDDKLEMLRFMSEFGGTRMNNYTGGIDNLAFIDDTTHNGTTANKLRDKFGKDISVISMFSTSFGAEHIEKFGELLEPPHILEWNFFNSGYVTTAMFDIDGVFCDNVPIDVCEDEEKYIKWLAEAKPIQNRIPRLFKMEKLVTGRLEKFRGVTESWLAKHGFWYDELIMFPTEREQERNRNHFRVVGEFKGEVFNSYHHKYFIESELSEGRVIKECIGDRKDKVVICPNDGVVL